MPLNILEVMNNLPPREPSYNVVPPDHDPDAIYDYVSERYIIGYLLAKPDYWKHAIEEVRPEDFYVPLNRKAMEVLYRDGWQTPEDLAGCVPGLPVESLRAWRADAEYDFDTREIRRRAIRVASLAMRRKALEATRAIVDDLTDPNVGEHQAVVKAKERLELIVAPDSPPEDPNMPVDVFMGMTDDAYDWIIPDILARRERVLLTATGGTGKSFLLRQLALCVAAGIHPFTGYPIEPKRVLLLDLENSAEQVRRKLRASYENVGPFDHDRLRIVAHPKVIDVTTDAGWRWLSGQASDARPDFIVGGPVYRMYEGGDTSKDMGGRDRARQVVTVLDMLRDRWNCALALEAHPPKGSESLSPHGSALWEWWPEAGVGIRADAEAGVDVVNVSHWRYTRDERRWPKKLARGGAYGFSVIG